MRILIFVLMLLVCQLANTAVVFTKQPGTFEQCKSTSGALRYRCIAGTGCKTDILKCVSPAVCPQHTTGTPPACVPIPCGQGFTGNQPNCVPIIVNPPLVPPTGSLMPAVDVSKIPTGDVGTNEVKLRTTNEKPVPSPDDRGAFRIRCEFSHMNFDDAIVFPGIKNATHLHAYFGNTNVDYQSTPESVRTTGNSTCWGGIINRSAYWVPAIIDTSTGAPVKPTFAHIYYKHGVVQPIPRGLRMISGDAKRSTSVTPAWERMAYFQCNGKYENKIDNIMPCGSGALQMLVEFPHCWDGKNLDSPNHKDHMAIVDGACPASHPVRLPTITVIVAWPITSPAGTANWRLASDNYAKNGYNAGFSAHGDFMMGWQDDIHKTFVDKCINPALDCHMHLLGDGRRF